MFLKDKVRKYDILQYKPEPNNFVGSFLSAFQWGGKYCHSAIYMADFLYQICSDFDETNEMHRRILTYTDDLLPIDFDETDVKLLLKTRANDLKCCKLESHIDSGVVIKPIDPKDLSLIDIYRIKLYITNACATKLDQAGIEFLGQGYDFLAFPGAWTRYTMLGLGFQHYADSRAIYGDPKGVYCSELVCKVFEKAMNYSIVEDLQPCFTPPSAISNSKRVELIC